MDGRTHSKIFGYFLPFFLILTIIMKLYVFIPLLLLSNPIVDPDEDQKWSNGAGHRSILTHSIFYSIMIVIVFGITTDTTLEWYFQAVMICSLPVLVHLILDIPTHRHKMKGENGEYLRDKRGKYITTRGERVGKYRVSFYPFKKRLSGSWTVIWLLVNILIIIGIWVVYFFYV